MGVGALVYCSLARISHSRPYLPNTLGCTQRQARARVVCGGAGVCGPRMASERRHDLSFAGPAGGAHCAGSAYPSAALSLEPCPSLAWPRCLLRTRLPAPRACVCRWAVVGWGVPVCCLKVRPCMPCALPLRCPPAPLRSICSLTPALPSLCADAGACPCPLAATGRLAGYACCPAAASARLFSSLGSRSSRSSSCYAALALGCPFACALPVSVLEAWLRSTHIAAAAPPGVPLLRLRRLLRCRHERVACGVRMCF